MKSTTTPIQSLSAKLQARNEQLAEETKQELEKLTTSLSSQLESALNSTMDDTRQNLALMQKQQRLMLKISSWTWMKPLLFSLPVAILLVTIFGLTGWRLGLMLEDSITTLMTHNRALAALPAAGLELIEEKGNLFLITPKGSEKPLVYRNENYPGKWIIKLED